MWLEILAVVSSVVGLGGILMGILERRSRIRIEEMHKGQLLAVLDRTNRMVGSTQYIEGMLKNIQNPDTARWVWSRHKGLCDLYVMTVSHYLSKEKTFSYDDLETLVRSGIVSSKWEERIWRSLIAQRSENKGVPVPPNFIP